MKTIRQTHTTKAHLEGTFSVFLPKLISSYIQKLFENLDACFSYYFFHPDNAIAFFCVKSWCCTVHQKSNILFKKSTFFFKTIVEKTTQSLLKTKLIEVKKFFEISEKI